MDYKNISKAEACSKEYVEKYGDTLFSFDLVACYKASRYDDRTYTAKTYQLGRGKPYLDCIELLGLIGVGDGDFVIGCRPVRSYNYNNENMVPCITAYLYPLGK